MKLYSYSGLQLPSLINIHTIVGGKRSKNLSSSPFSLRLERDAGLWIENSLLLLECMHTILLFGYCNNLIKESERSERAVGIEGESGGGTGQMTSSAVKLLPDG